MPTATEGSMSENRSDRVLEVANYSPWPRDTRERLCPHCRNADIVGLGQTFASATGVRSAYRCGACAKEFWLRAERRLGAPDRRTTS